MLDLATKSWTPVIKMKTHLTMGYKILEGQGVLPGRKAMKIMTVTASKALSAKSTHDTRWAGKKYVTVNGPD